MVAEAQPALPALSPEYLAGAMRDLLLHGNHVAYIGIIGGQIVLDRAASYYITGGPSQRTWFYRGYLHGPTQNMMRQVNQAGVVHLRIGATRISPWEGVSPLSKAGITAQVLGKVERSLSHELNAITGKILTYPTIPALETAEGQQQTKAGIDALAGRMAMVQSGGGEAARWGSGGPSGGGGAWSQVGLGPEVESNMVALRAQVAQDILSILGIPAGLFSPREGAVSRESYRQLLTATISPYARLMEREFSDKLDTPVKLQFHRLAAADVAARARAYQSLRQAQLPEKEARTLSGLDD